MRSVTVWRISKSECDANVRRHRASLDEEHADIYENERKLYHRHEHAILGPGSQRHDELFGDLFAIPRCKFGNCWHFTVAVA
jgi:hypothetical protein